MKKKIFFFALVFAEKKKMKKSKKVLRRLGLDSLLFCLVRGTFAVSDEDALPVVFRAVLPELVLIKLGELLDHTGSEAIREGLERHDTRVGRDLVEETTKNRENFSVSFFLFFEKERKSLTQ